MISEFFLSYFLARHIYFHASSIEFFFSYANAILYKAFGLFSSTYNTCDYYQYLYNLKSALYTLIKLTNIIVAESKIIE